MDSLYAFLAAVGGGLLASFVTLALLPAMEWLFAYTTDVTLLELANLNHPLLRELILRAPGTYHHSMIVGSLSEAACEAIGANGLLARVACYYHDVGKMRNADYFAENFKPGDNPHNRLKPSMSSLIIRSHVKDTIELLTRARRPGAGHRHGHPAPRQDADRVLLPQGGREQGARRGDPRGGLPLPGAQAADAARPA